MATQEAYDLLGEIKIDKSPVASERKEAQGILDEIKLDRQNPTALPVPSIKSPVPEQRSFARRILDAVMYSDNPPGPGEVPQDQTTQLGVVPPHSSALDPAKKFLFDAPAEAAANIRENPALSMVTLGKGLVNAGYGLRADGTQKGSGYFGELKMKDGSGKVATEIGIGVNINGKETEIPSLVPTLTEKEKDYLLGGGKPTPEIVQKAVAHAHKRMAAGLSPFADSSPGDLTPEEASKASNMGISEQEILDEARKTGQVPYGKILANRLQSEAAGFVPLTPTEVAIAESIPKVLEGAAIGLQRVLPEWASKPILSTLKEWAANKEIKVPLTNEDIRNFYTFGKEKLDPRTYDILQSIDPEILKKAAKQGEGFEAKVKVSRFGGGNVPRETIPKSVDRQIDSGFNPDLAREMASGTPAAHSPSLAREIVEMPTPKEFQTPEAGSAEVPPTQEVSTPANTSPQEPTPAQAPPTSVPRAAPPALEPSKPSPVEMKVFQGTGRPDAGSVYTFKGAEPILGKDAQYYALDQQTARKFGPDIKQHSVSLENPLVINSPQDWEKLTKSVGIYPDFVNNMEPEATRMQKIYADRDKVLAQIKKLGHDGVIVSPSAIEANGHRNPVARLFGDPQIIKFKTSPKTNEGATGSSIPKTVQRIEEPGVGRATPDKLHGIYTTPGDVKSPHEDLGGEKFLWKTNPNAKVLSLDEFPSKEISMREMARGAGAGVHAAREILGPKEFSTLKEMPRGKLEHWAKETLSVDVSKYYDKQEIMETIGAVLARKKGYDAIYVKSDKAEWNEYVILNEKAASPIETTQGLQSTQGMSAEKWSVNLPSEPIGGTKPITRVEMLKHFERAYQAPIKGKATHRMGGGEQGHFQRIAQHIRLKNWGEIEVLSHEAAGHAMDHLIKQKHGADWKINIIPSTLKGAAKQELGALDYNPKKKRLSEGFAEYMRHWITLGDEDAFAPTWGPKFKEWLAKNEPGFMKSVQEQKAMYQRYKDQGAIERMIQQIDFTGETPKGARPTIKERAAADFAEFRRRWSDEFTPIHLAQESLGIKSVLTHLNDSNVKPSEDPFLMLTAFKMKSHATANMFVTEAAVNEAGDKVGPSLQEIMAPILPKEAWTLKTYLKDVVKNGPLFRTMKEFVAYGAAHRVVTSLAPRGIESGFDLKDAKYTYDKLKNPVWDKAWDEIREWNNHARDWLLRANALSPADALLMDYLDPDYVRFKRVFYDEFEGMAGKGSGREMAAGSGLRRMHGSARPIVNPIEAMIEQVATMIRKAHEFRVMNAIKDWVRVPGHGKFMSKVPVPLEKTSFSLEKISSQLHDLGIKLGDADLKTMLDVFTTADKYKGRENIKILWNPETGKKEAYEISPALATVLQGMDDNLLDNKIMHFMAHFARMRRLGFTGVKISFGLIKNPARDIFSYAVNLLSGRKNPALGYLSGLKSAITSKPGDLGFAPKAMGGEMSIPIGYDRDSQMDVYDQMLLSKMPAGKFLKVVKHPIDAFRTLTSVIEAAPRQKEFLDLYKKFKKEHPGWDELDLRLAAFTVGYQDVTTNFTRSGTVSKQLNNTNAFFNVNLQEPVKIYRTAKQNPAGFFLRGMTYIGSLALALWYKNKDKQWFKSLPPSYRYNNFFVETPLGIVRIPFPFLLGTIFAGLPMALADYLDKEDPELLKEFMKNIPQNTLPSLIPDIISPLVDVARNVQWPGRPIESERMKEYLPTERTQYYTSELAKVISRGANAFGWELSPVQIDYLLYAYSGGLPSQFRSYSGIKEPADVPVLGDVLVRAPEKPTYQLGLFYDEYNRLSQKAATQRAKEGSFMTAPELLRYEQMEVFNKFLKQANAGIQKASSDGNVKEVHRLNKIVSDAFENTGIMDYKKRSK